MAFTREFIRKTAKESGVEIPKELEDALIDEHLSARDAFAEGKVKDALEENKPDPTPNVKETQEYKDLQKSFDDYKQAQASKEARAAKETAFRDLLKTAGVSEKRIDSVVKVSDIDGLELEDGKLKGADALMESVRTEWADFIDSQTNNGVKVDLSGKVGGGKTESEPRSLAEALHAKYEQKG